MEQEVNDSEDPSELEQLEQAIANLRQCQNDLKNGAYDPQKVQFIKEWLIDLYTIRKHHPRFKPVPKKPENYQVQRVGDILLLDPDLIDIAAKTEFTDPFEVNKEEQESAMVRELMDGLTIMEYEAVTMCWLNGLGPTEAARYMGCSARNVSTYLIRARTKMMAKYHNFSQMVLSGFDFPPTLRRNRRQESKGSGPAKIRKGKNQRTQLTLF